MKLKLALGLILSTATIAALAGSVDDQIRFRQSAYSFMGWNTAKIKSLVVDHPETYNKDQAIAAANAIAAVANSGLLGLYGTGTDHGVGWKPTHLKSDYFQKQDEVKEISAKFIKEANELQTVAATGDVASVKAQFGKLGAACKSCHDLIRVRE
jgi:cytochrome c556